MRIKPHGVDVWFIPWRDEDGGDVRLAPVRVDERLEDKVFRDLHEGIDTPYIRAMCWDSYQANGPTYRKRHAEGWRPK